MPTPIALSFAEGCAHSPRSNVQAKYACARRYFARLASEIFLSSLQSGSSRNLLDKDPNYKFEIRKTNFEANSNDQKAERVSRSGKT